MNNRASLLNRPGVFYYQIKALENILATRDPISYVGTLDSCALLTPKKSLLKKKILYGFYDGGQRLTFGPPNVKNVTLVFKAHFQPCFEMSSHFSFNVTEPVTKLRMVDFS